MGSLPKTAVIIPCYNEAGRLKSGIFLKALEDNPHLSFVFVNDGSKDRTQQVLEELTASCPHRVFLLKSDSNQGKSEAVRRGFLFAMPNHYDYLGYWDADLATPLETLNRFIQILASNTATLLIMGARVKLLGRKIMRRRARHYLGRIFATWASLVLQLEVYDTQCGAKLFRNTEIVQKVFLSPFISKWIFDIEIIARLNHYLKKSDEDIADYLIEYPLEQWEDVKGSKLKPWSFLVGGVDLAKIAFKYGRG